MSQVLIICMTYLAVTSIAVYEFTLSTCFPAHPLSQIKFHCQQSVNMKPLLIISFVALFSSVQSTNLALVFKANNSTCSAACSTCDNKETQDSTDIQQLINVTQNNTQAINDIVVSLSHIRNATTSNAGAINNILLLVEEILQLQNRSSISPIPTSCQKIKNKKPNSASGVYLLATPSGKTNYVYCHMGELCDTEGGWTRLAYLDMSDSAKACPSGFKLYESNGTRACGKESNVAGCQSVKFPSNGINYSQVCGRVVGYQYGSTDAVDTTYGTGGNDINSNYVDGVSITHGSPRQHIWTLMSGVAESQINTCCNCPCSQGTLTNPQSFIGNDYFCESGGGQGELYLHTQDPLWDGNGCSPLESNCCSVPGLPWFNKILNSTTTDYIELRVCADESDEDVPVSFYELYVK